LLQPWLSARGAREKVSIIAGTGGRAVLIVEREKPREIMEAAR
jgi:hypothetical protein